MTDLKVGHIFWDYNGNWGDKILGLGTQKLFRKYLGLNDIETFPIQDYKKLNEELHKMDLIIVGGGGMIGWMSRRFIKHIGKRIKKKIIQAKAPFIVYAVGLNLFRTEDGREKIMPAFKEKGLRKLVKKALYFSVRSDGTKEALAPLGFNFKESPDPALWAHWNENLERKVEDDYILIQIAGDMPNARFSFNNVNLPRFCDDINSIADFLISKGYKVQFPLHRGEDVICTHHIDKSDKIIPWIWNEEVERVRSGLSYYKYSKMVIGMRGHSQIIPFGFGVPVISIVNQEKNINFMEKIGMEKYAVDIFDPDLVKKIKKHVVDIEKNYTTLKILYDWKLEEQRKQVEEEFKEIKRRVESI